MAVGYEARARVTADMSGFVSAAREAAQASGTMATAVRELNAELKQTQQLAKSSANAVKPFAQASQDSARAAQQNASATMTASEAARQGAAEYNAAANAAQDQAVAMERNTVSTRAMGREMEKLEGQLNTLDQIQRKNGELTERQSQAYGTFSTRLGELRTAYNNLTDEQREAVDTSRELARAQDATRAAQASMTTYAREAAKEQSELAQAQRRTARAATDTQTQLKSMGRELSDLRAKQEKYQALLDRGVSLNRDQAESFRTVEARINQLTARYIRLSADERRVVTEARELAQANRMAAQASRDAATAAAVQDRAMRELTGSLWSMRSAVGDVSMAMDQLWNVAQQATQYLWQNFSAQEMAIAQISRVSQATSIEMDRITDSVRQMSTEIPIAFEELGRIAMLGSQVGVATDALGEFTETVALFSATSDVTADKTATMMARIMEMTNLPHSQVTELGSAVAYLGSNSAATDNEILTTIESISTMTTQAGMSTEATVGLASAMASLRVRPEIARGATQRVFLQLSQAINTTGAEMEKLSEVTGMSQEALQKLKADDFDDFFLTIMEGLGKAAESGEDLVPMLREIGILNTRDAEVVARLASNYDLLANSVDGSREAFADGNYLYAESDRIFSTLTAKVQILANVWGNFWYSAMEAVAPALTAVVEATTAVIQFVDALGLAPVMGWAAAGLAVAGALGLVAASVGYAYQGVLAFQGLLNLTTKTTTANAAATTANAAATTAASVASGRMATAESARAAALAASGASAWASTAAMGAFTAGVTTATAAVRTFVLAHPALALAAVATAAVAASVAWDKSALSAQAHERAVLKANEAHLNAAGGMDALKQALETDTQAWMDAKAAAGEYINDLENTTNRFSTQAQELVENSYFRVDAMNAMSEADREAAEAAEGLTARQEEISEELGKTSDSASSTSDEMGGLAQSERELAQAGVEADNSLGKINGTLDDAGESAESAATAVGLATRNIAALSLESAIAESGILENADAFEELRASGANLGAALTMEMREAGSGVEYLNAHAQKLREEMNFIEQEWNANIKGDRAWFDWLLPDALATDTEDAAAAFETFAENLEATSLSIEQANNKAELLEGTFINLPDGTRATTEELEALAAGGEEAAAMAMVLESEVNGLGISVGTLRDGFASFIDPMAVWTETQQAAAEAAENTELSLLDVEGGFSSYLDNLEEASNAQMNWATNLMELADEVPPHVLAGLTEMGEGGADIVEGLVNATDDEVDRFVDVWDQGGGMVLDNFSVVFSDFISRAALAGDEGGLALIEDLMAQMANGDITFREAVDQMTTYAETEFDEADPVVEGQMDNTKAMKELTHLMRRLNSEMQTANDNAVVTPSWRSGGFWGALSSWWSSVKTWWNNNVHLTTTPTVNSNAGMYGSQGGGTRRADGGWVRGPGGQREDKVPLWASPDEFVVNAWSAQRYADELEWINNQRPGAASATPNFVPDDIMDIARTSLPSPGPSLPDGLAAAMRTNSVASGPRTVINVTNYYPQAEPTSVTVNRSLAYDAVLDGA